MNTHLLYPPHLYPGLQDALQKFASGRDLTQIAPPWTCEVNEDMSFEWNAHDVDCLLHDCEKHVEGPPACWAEMVYQQLRLLTRTGCFAASSDVYLDPERASFAWEAHWGCLREYGPRAEEVLVVLVLTWRYQVAENATIGRLFVVR